MNEDLSLSEDGARLIKAFESCAAPSGNGMFKPYVCPGGVLTIGWGHTNHHGRQFAADALWTPAECDEAFREDMREFEAEVRRRVNVRLNQHQFDALISFTYNCGSGNFAASTLLRKVNVGDFAAAALEFHKWNKANKQVLLGLVRRRASEALMFQGIPDKNHDGQPDSMARNVENPD